MPRAKGCAAQADCVKVLLPDVKENLTKEDPMSTLRFAVARLIQHIQGRDVPSGYYWA
jgi:hypothetical protein